MEAKYRSTQYTVHTQLQAILVTAGTLFQKGLLANINKRRPIALLEVLHMAHAGS